MRFAFALFLISVVGCREVAHDVKDVQTKAAAKKWSGMYVFNDCAADGACWKYTFAIDGDAELIVTVEGAQPTPRLKGKAREYHDNELTLFFSSYADEKVDLVDFGPVVFEPLRGRYTPGQHLALIKKEGPRTCLTFDGMDSKLGTKSVCAAP